MTHTLEDTVAEQDASAEAGTQERPAVAGSTLLEFPGARSIPQWRKDLSERVREIQQRKAREAALEAEQAEDYVQEQPRAQDARTDQHAADTAAATHEGDAREGAVPSTHLGLVPPPPDAPELNPLVAAALARIERARQPQTQAPAHGLRPGASNRRAAAAVARAAEERYEPRARPQAPPKKEARPAAPRQEAARAPEARHAAAETEAPRLPNLVAVPPPPSAPAVEQRPAHAPQQGSTTVADAPSEAAHVETPASGAPAPSVTESPAAGEAVAQTRTEPATTAVVPQTKTVEAETSEKPRPRRVVEGVVDDAWLARLEERILPPVNAAARTADDVAPLLPRVAAGLLDLLVVAFLSSPFAAIIELTNGNWQDPRVAASMGGIVLVVFFLYETVSTGLAGRTFAMSLFRLHSVDAETALAPTLGQCVRRTLLYIVSLATLGIGILYALFDAERRTAHDHLSGTVVVRH